MRRKDRAITDEQAFSLLKNGEYGVLSTVDENNQPYGVPVNYVVMDGMLFFHCAATGHKLHNINANKHVSFCVVGCTEILADKFATKYESVIIFGTASRVQENDKKEPLMALLEKYSPAHMETGKKYLESMISKTEVIAITIDRITGKGRK